MVSLAQEHFSDTKRQLFGPNFDQRLKTRSRTAGIIWRGLQRGETFFRGGASQGFQRPWNQYRQFRPIPTGSKTIDWIQEHTVPELLDLQTQSVKNLHPTN